VDIIKLDFKVKEYESMDGMEVTQDISNGNEPLCARKWQDVFH
jgi:hypothetical protein